MKIVRSGTSSGINIPRPILIRLGWLPGQRVIVELLEDESIRIRLPKLEDFVQLGKGRVVYDEPGVVTR